MCFQVMCVCVCHKQTIIFLKLIGKLTKIEFLNLKLPWSFLVSISLFCNIKCINCISACVVEKQSSLHGKEKSLTAAKYIIYRVFDFFFLISLFKRDINIRKKERMCQVSLYLSLSFFNYHSNYILQELQYGTEFFCSGRYVLHFPHTQYHLRTKIDKKVLENLPQTSYNYVNRFIGV